MDAETTVSFRPLLGFLKSHTICLSHASSSHESIIQITLPTRRHIFCPACLDTYIQRSNSCPLCRTLWFEQRSQTPVRVYTGTEIRITVRDGGEERMQEAVPQ